MLGPGVGSSAHRTPLLGCTDHSGGPPWAGNTVFPGWVVPSSTSETIPGQARPHVTSPAPPAGGKLCTNPRGAAGDRKVAVGYLVVIFTWDEALVQAPKP